MKEINLEQAPPQVITPCFTKTGDLWQLGKHKLLCGDSTRLTSYQVLFGNTMADMTVTDPPYNVAYKRAYIEGDNQGAAFEAFLRVVCGYIVKHTRGGIYISMASSEMYSLKRAFEKAGGHWSTFIIWAKNHFSIGRSDYHRQFEPILYGWSKYGKRHWCGDRTQSDLWFHKKISRCKLHPTMKPIDLLERAIRNSSQPDDIVLDPFGGSGSTLIACEQTNRKCRMIEIEPQYVEVIINRWKQATGKEAIRVEQTF